jgi:hypothetical protein
MISTHLYLYKHDLSEIGIHLSKERKKTQTFKTFIFVKLFKQDEVKNKTI